jgi:cobalt-zinc-cadmium efflux system membrane fusion protein
MIRLMLLAGGITLGTLIALLFPEQMSALRVHLVSVPGMFWAATPEPASKAPQETGDAPEHDEGTIKLSAEQIAAAKIGVADVNSGVLGRRVFVPGSIIPSGDRIARVAIKIVGTVTELRKRIGDTVEQNEVVAVIESREVADAKSEYLAARVTHELQEILTSRAKALVAAKGMAENEYLRTRAAFDNARVHLDVTRQKLFALGLTEEQIAALPQQASAALRLQELRSPISGQIAERRVDLGGLVGREGQESELFIVVRVRRSVGSMRPVAKA